MHICTQASPMRVNSDPDDWTHPDATEAPDTYTDTSSMGPMLGLPMDAVGTSAAFTCPHCNESEYRPVASRGIVGGFDPELRGKRLKTGEGVTSC